MEEKVFSSNDIKRANGCVVIQTCDSYKKYWDSFFWSFNKYWDKSLNWDIYFCNENIDINQKGFKQLKTGSGSHSQRLQNIIENLNQYDYIFYLLEDFWLTDYMPKDLFLGLFNLVSENNWDSLRVAPYMPAFYKLDPTDIVFNNKRILKYRKDSEWKFSQQASFWKRDFLKKCIIEPEVSEVKISSSITGETAMDQYLNARYPEAEIYHYHYHWYPVSGAVWRGQLTQIGEQIDFIRNVESLIDAQFPVNIQL